MFKNFVILWLFEIFSFIWVWHIFSYLILDYSYLQLFKNTLTNQQTIIDNLTIKFIFDISNGKFNYDLKNAVTKIILSIK